MNGACRLLLFITLQRGVFGEWWVSCFSSLLPPFPPCFASQSLPGSVPANHTSDCDGQQCCFWLSHHGSIAQQQWVPAAPHLYGVAFLLVHSSFFLKPKSPNRKVKANLNV